MLDEKAIVTGEICHERASEQAFCGYEDCQRPIEIQPGHRRREYCNSACRKAAQRLRKRREQQGEKADYFIKKVQSPRLRGILEQILREQGEVALLRLVVAIDDERAYVQGSDEMQQRVADLEIKLSYYREIVDLDDRQRICQQFIAAGQLVGYRALPKFHIREGIEAWRDYESWTHEATLAEVILYCRELADQETAAKERSKLRQVERQLAAARAKVEASDAMQQRINDLEAEVHTLHRELARYAPPPRELLECTLRRWSTKVSLPYDELKPDRIDTFLQDASERKLLSLIEWSESTYFIGKYRSLRIKVIQKHLSETEPYQGDPALSLRSVDDQGYAIFATGDRQFMDTDSVERSWAQIVGKHGQQVVGSNPRIAPLQQYLCDHPEGIPICDGKRKYEIIMIDDDALAVTKNLRPKRLYTEDDIEQALQWVNRDTKRESRLVELASYK